MPGWWIFPARTYKKIHSYLPALLYGCNIHFNTDRDFVLFSSVARGNEIPSALIVGVNVCKHVKNYADYTALTTLVP